MGDNAAALAIETSSASGSVAVGRSGEVLGVRRFSQPRAHAVEFLPSINELCLEHGIRANEIRLVFVSAGPGSFTGLRIGITAARTLALANGASIVALPTLEVIAQNALALQPPPKQVCVLLDAKRARVYSATFVLEGRSKTSSADAGHIDRSKEIHAKYVCIDSPREADPVSYLAQQPRDCAVLGEGVPYHQAAVSNSELRILPPELFPPRVETVYRLGWQRALLGEFVPARDLIPVYIRPPEAEEVWAARHA